MNEIRVTTALILWNTLASVNAGIVMVTVVGVTDKGFVIRDLPYPVTFSLAATLAVATWIRANIAFERGDVEIPWPMLFVLIASLLSLLVALLMFIAGDSFGFFPLGVHVILWGVQGWLGRGSRMPAPSKPEGIRGMIRPGDLERSLYFIEMSLGLGLVIGSAISALMRVPSWAIGQSLTSVVLFVELLLIAVMEYQQVSPVGTVPADS